MAAYAPYEFMRVTFPASHVAHVEINRASKLNAFSRPMWLEFGRVFRQLGGDADVRAVVLSGAGDRAFTAGLDVTAASTEGPLSGTGGEDLDPARRAKALRGHIEEFQECISDMERCEKPVICAMHGVALGLAVDIACCADIRLAASNTVLAVKEVNIGLAADVGTLARLPKIVGSTSWVKDVCLSARDFSAREALQVGFVSQVFEDKARTVQAALDMASRLAEKSPVAVQGTKELLNHARDNGTAAALRYTAVWNSVALQAGDLRSALTSVFSKKKPTFEKL
ncbi:enoyl-CoA hydratase/isomerase family protein [Metarhizium album ARSEF 1941]|uniref:Enoyl-CoA hydratase/isomerase family protein n=1 Tax=Metarhizium album (strain ARSEF 1941) TaxID=1081103 RepID=A0A0B2WSP2_METAS|nr:enoyl-CoA hydratase/isomerase family protein [Metarhizium album ARSEF 1941]KHN96639.1 enoyl-CoA hydratase/isomerase family protein [Metarhizium album ARSEF 1941]